MTEQEVTLAAQQVSQVLLSDAAHVEAVAAKVLGVVKGGFSGTLAWVGNKVKVWGPWVAGAAAAVAHFVLGVL